jgi:hypothetical protein
MRRRLGMRRRTNRHLELIKQQRAKERAFKERNHNLIHSVWKATEGGIGQKFAMFLLREAGIVAEPAGTIYVGHSGIRVYGGNRIQRRAERILLGR